MTFNRMDERLTRRAERDIFSAFSSFLFFFASKRPVHMYINIGTATATAGWFSEPIGEQYERIIPFLSFITELMPLFTNLYLFYCALAIITLTLFMHGENSNFQIILSYLVKDRRWRWMSAITYEHVYWKFSS